ncbi:MAG: hypothetical protein ACXABO_10915 [Promethearchaeota archaeon]|jgi:chromosome segregation ATPase
MSDEHEEHEENEDKSIVDALSTLGWVEEKEDEEESELSDENLSEQLNYFKEENQKLITELNEKLQTINSLESKLEELVSDTQDKSVDDQALQKLYETIESKNDEIELLNTRIDEESAKSQKIISDQVEKIRELTSHLEESQSDQTDLSSEKDAQIKELKEQLQYLEDDTIQKSKFQKVEVLLEKKDEIITEKEKTIFALENSLKTANQRTQEIQQQQETFNLIKKDLEKKTERNKELVFEIEELKQKYLANKDLITHFEEKLEEAHNKTGIITGKFEVELGNLRVLLDGKSNELKEIKEDYNRLENELKESKSIDEKILVDVQNLKDEKLKMESELVLKASEIIELKKKIKLMRRDFLKS